MTFSAVVRIEKNVRSHRDSRRKVDRHILSYIDNSQHDLLGKPFEYRVSIETPRGDYELAPGVTNGLGNTPCHIAIPTDAKSTLDIMRIVNANVLAHPWTAIHHPTFENYLGKARARG